LKTQFRINYDDQSIDIFEKVSKALSPFGIVVKDDGEEHDSFMIFNVSVSPELEKAATQVFDDGQQNWDQGAGWPPPDGSVQSAYDTIKKFTKYGESQGDA